MSERRAYDLATWMYQAHGARLYRLCVRTLASAVYMEDGQNVETRVNTLERALANNTTTRLVGTIAERDKLTGVIPGDRAYVREGKGACYCWLPPAGWALLWTGSSPLNLADAIKTNGGIGLDSAARLYVDWSRMLPELEPKVTRPLFVDGDRLGVEITDSLETADSEICASAMAAWLLNERMTACEAAAAESGEEAAKALEKAILAQNAANAANSLADTANATAEEAKALAEENAALLAEMGPQIGAAASEAGLARAQAADAATLATEAERLATALEWVDDYRETLANLPDLSGYENPAPRLSALEAGQTELNGKVYDQGETINALLAAGEETRELAQSGKETADEALEKAGELENALAEMGEPAVMTGATETEAGTAGYVPAPEAGKDKSFLRGDGQWAEMADEDIPVVTDQTDGLMIASDKAAFEAAKENGQIGNAINKGRCNANDLKAAGNYLVYLTDSDSFSVFANNWPQKSNNYGLCRVSHTGESITQCLIMDVGVWVRTATQTDAVWGRWRPARIETSSGSIYIYLSKSGNDNNTGLDTSYPVLTFGRACEIANAVVFSNGGLSRVGFRFGAGNWGDINLSCMKNFICFYPYDGSQPTEYSSNLPVFGTIDIRNSYVYFQGIICSYISAVYNTTLCFASGYKRVSYIYACYGSSIVFTGSNSSATSIVEFIQDNLGVTSNVGIMLDVFASLYISNIQIKLGSNCTSNRFLYVGQGCTAYINSSFSVSLDSYTFTGLKYDIRPGGITYTSATAKDLTALNELPGTSHTVYSGALINGMPWGAAVGNEVATTALTRNLLGNGTSTVALATLDEAAEDYVETLETKKLKTIAKINAEAQRAIYAGFLYEIDGAEYHIGYSLFDQQNLASRAIVASRNPGKVIQLPCEDETGQTVWLDVETEVVLAVHKYGLINHTDAIRKAAGEKKALIMAAESEEEIQAIYME